MYVVKPIRTTEAVWEETLPAVVLKINFVFDWFEDLKQLVPVD